MADVKSQNDLIKEQKEASCFEAAYRVSLEREGKTKEIMEYLHGVPYYNRSHNDSPDLIYICKKGAKAKRETVVGIEHFCVSQCSQKKGDRIQAVDLKSKSELRKTYELGRTEKEEIGTISEEIGCKLLEQCCALSLETLSCRYNLLIDSFHYAIGKHMERANQYRQNLEKIADERHIELAFLIEVQTYFPNLFLNSDGKISRLQKNTFPMLKGLVGELEKIDKNLVDYIIICNTEFNAIQNNTVSAAIAVRTGNIKKHLSDQHIPILDYIGEDRYETSPVKFEFSGAIGPSIAQNETYCLPNTIETNSESELREAMLKAVRAAFIARKHNLSFVTTRPVQFALYALEPELDEFSEINGQIMLIFKTRKPQNDMQAEVKARYKSFANKYPLQNDKI